MPTKMTRALSPTARRALELLVAETVRTDYRFVSGKRLRHSLRKHGVPDFGPALRELTPTLVHYAVADRGGNDSYLITLTGLLASERAGDVRTVLAGVLAVIQRNFDANPEFTHYTHAELREVEAAVANIEPRLIDHILHSAHLINGGNGGPGAADWRWGVPQNVEAIALTQSVDTFITACVREEQAWLKAHGGPSRRADRSQPKPHVFVVHGHDHELKHIVLRVLEREGIKAIALDEQPNRGQTIIEKLEAFGEPDYAIILMSPDDLGCAKRNTRRILQPRARQNVILELGILMGTIGRRNICVVRKGDIEWPSDLSGVLHIDGDDPDGLRLRLLTELREVGILKSRGRAGWSGSR